MGILETSLQVLSLTAVIMVILNHLWKFRRYIWKGFMAFCPTSVKTYDTYQGMDLLAAWIHDMAIWKNGVFHLGQHSHKVKAPAVSVVFWKKHPLLCIRIHGPDTVAKTVIAGFLGMRHSYESKNNNNDDGVIIYAPTTIFGNADEFFRGFFTEVEKGIPTADPIEYVGPNTIYHTDGNNRSYPPNRDPDCVLMHPGVRSRLIEILDDYQSEETEDRVYRTGQNSTLGFIFHGPPGTGKSSVAWWVAYWFGALELHQYSADQVKKGRYVHTSSSGATVYALHDIDRIISDAGDEEGQGKVRQDFDLNTLLNVLDGTLAADNQIYILTANDASKIPEAVKSRCHTFLIGDPTEDMLVRAFEIYYDVEDDGAFREAIRKVMQKGITIRALHKYCRGKKTPEEATSRLDELHKFKELEEHEKR